MVLYKNIYVCGVYLLLFSSFVNSYRSFYKRSGEERDSISVNEDPSSEWYEYNEDDSFHEGLTPRETPPLYEPTSSPSIMYIDNVQNGEEGRIVREDMCANRGEIHRSIKALDCSTPILKTVKLMAPGPNFAIVPSVAQVKKCSGHCNHPRSCLPSRKSTVRIPVYKFDKTNSTNPPTCVEYELEQHEECRCGCAVQRQHCKGNQVYDAMHCTCRCSNDEEKNKCTEMILSNAASLVVTRFWDDQTCTCKCIQRHCGIGRVWVPGLCRCVSIADDEEPENLLFL